MIMPTAAAHARVDVSRRVPGVTPYPLLIRPWMGMPNWARISVITLGLGGGGLLGWLLSD